jgi:hypothetical protein
MSWKFPGLLRYNSYRCSIEISFDSAEGSPSMNVSVASRPPVRLTRRGRVVVVCAVALVLLAGLWMGARHGAGAASGGATAPATARESVVVGPHDTLWGIAVRTRPDVDPRVTVERMIDLNALPSAVVNPGQTIYIPAR